MPAFDKDPPEKRLWTDREVLWAMICVVFWVIVFFLARHQVDFGLEANRPW